LVTAADSASISPGRAPRNALGVIAVLSSIPVATTAFAYGAVIDFSLRAVPLSSKMPAQRLGNLAALMCAEAILIGFILSVVSLAIAAFRAVAMHKPTWLVAFLAFILTVILGAWDYLHAAPGFSLIGPLSLPAFPAMLALLWVVKPSWRAGSLDA
jgi:hypothetical protein